MLCALGLLTGAARAEDPAEGRAESEVRSLALDLDHRLERGDGLEALVALERASIATGERERHERADRALRRLRRIRSAVATTLVYRLPRLETVDRLVEEAVGELHRRDVRLRQGGSNALLVQLFDRPRPHPGSAGATLGEAHWIDCDGAALLLLSIVDEVERRTGLGLRPRLGVLMTPDHLALAVASQSGEWLVIELRPPGWTPGTLVQPRLVPLDVYRRVYRERGQEIAIATDWQRLASHTWRIAAADLLRRGEEPERALAWARQARHGLASVADPARLTEALALRELGRADEARAELEALLEGGFVDPRALSALASIELESDRPRRALEVAARAVALAPELPLVYRQRAAIWRALGEERSARADEERYRRLLGRSGPEPGLRFGVDRVAVSSTETGRDDRD